MGGGKESVKNKITAINGYPCLDRPQGAAFVYFHRPSCLHRYTLTAKRWDLIAKALWTVPGRLELEIRGFTWHPG
jgi:hypothetical protein